MRDGLTTGVILTELALVSTPNALYSDRLALGERSMPDMIPFQKRLHLTWEIAVQ